MGRTRSIDREALLDAAEAVAARDGSAGLTIEAVAQEAGISKASVLYDYKTKHALIAALIDRRLKVEVEARSRYAAANPGVSDPIVRSRIETARLAFSEGERAVALSVAGALSGDHALREPIQRFFRATIDTVRAQSPRPREAMLAFLATDGLLLAELFGLQRWEPAEREALLRDIEDLLRRSSAAEPAADRPVPARGDARRELHPSDRDR